jgi:hypothetical protein
MLIADYVNISKVSNGFYVSFHRTSQMPPGMEIYLKKIGQAIQGEDNEIELIRKRAAQKELRENRVGIDGLFMKAYDETFIFVTADIDKMLQFLKYVLLAELDPALLSETNNA